MHRHACTHTLFMSQHDVAMSIYLVESVHPYWRLMRSSCMCVIWVALYVFCAHVSQLSVQLWHQAFLTTILYTYVFRLLTSVCKHDFPANDTSNDVTALVDIIRLFRANLAPTTVRVGSVVAVMAFEAEKLKETGTIRCSSEDRSAVIWHCFQRCCKLLDGTPPSTCLSL